MVVFGTKLNTAAVSYTLVPWLLFLLCSMKYEHEEMVEHQQTKEMNREHKIFCLNEVVLGCYACFGCLSKMYQQQITVKIG